MVPREDRITLNIAPIAGPKREFGDSVTSHVRYYGAKHALSVFGEIFTKM